jgi:hypothetical protein
MNRARFVLGAALVGAIVVAGAPAQAQEQNLNEPLKPILQGKKFTPPIRGAANIELLKPVTARKGDSVITTIKVKNTSTAPIARLKVDETWYDKGGATVTASSDAINGLLQPGEVGTLTVSTPYNPKMLQNNWAFSHANGSVKPKRVDKFEGADDAKDSKAPAKAAAKPAAKK